MELTKLQSELFEAGKLPCERCKENPVDTLLPNIGAVCDDCVIPGEDYDYAEMGWSAAARADAMGWD